MPRQVRQGERTGDADACFSTDYCGFRCVVALPLALQQMLETRSHDPWASKLQLGRKV